MPPPPPPRPSAPAAPKAPAAPVAAAPKPVAAAPAPAAVAAPAADAKAARQSKFGPNETALPTELGGINIEWAKEAVKAAFAEVNLAGFSEAFENLNLQTVPNTADGKRFFKVCKALATFSSLLFKAARKARVASTLGSRQRQSMLELVRELTPAVIIAKLGQEKFDAFGFTAEELA